MPGVAHGSQAMERPNIIISAVDKRRSLLRPNIGNDDIVIAIMGMTGSGKSSFIKSCTQDASLERTIGHGWHSKTQLVEAYSFQHDGKKIWLLDTPGFNDTVMKPIETLREIADFLAEEYAQRRKLSGVVYLQSMIDTRVGGVGIKTLKTFREMVGQDEGTMKNVVLATTFWDLVDDLEDGNRKESEFLRDEQFWQRMSALKSPAFRLQGKPNSESRYLTTMAIITELISRNARIVLEIQKEMGDEGKNFDKTKAVIEINREFEEVKRELNKKLEQVQKDTDIAIAQGKEEAAQIQLERQEEYEKEMKALQALQDEIKKSYEDRLKDKNSKIDEILAREAALEERQENAIRELGFLAEELSCKSSQMDLLYKDHESMRLEYQEIKDRDSKLGPELQAWKKEQAKLQKELDRQAKELAKSEFIRAKYEAEVQSVRNQQQAAPSTPINWSAYVLPAILLMALAGVPSIPGLGT